MVKRGWIALLILLMIPLVYGIQVNSSTEIYTFDVINCQSNVSTLNCSAADVRFSCDITPYNYIDYTLFRVNGTDHTSSRSSEHFFYDWHKGITSSDVDTYIEFERGQIHDIGGGDALFFPNISVHLICDSCNYTVVHNVCQSDDTMLTEYIGDGAPNCTSYNQTESCDYCTPDWSITSDCLENDTELREYTDANSCYGVTGLYSDSCDYSYADCGQWINCSFLKSDMTCDFDVNPLIDLTKNRIYWKCAMDNSSESYDCISFVKQNGSIIQTNPQTKTYSSGLIPKEQETREFFTAQNGLVNPYFTTENLNSNLTYIFGVECSYSNGIVRSEHYVTPIFRNLDVVAYRSIWLKDNAGYIVGAFIFLILIIAIIVMWVNRR